MTAGAVYSICVHIYAGAALKCPVVGQFRLIIAERGWTRQNGPAILRALCVSVVLSGLLKVKHHGDRESTGGQDMRHQSAAQTCVNLKLSSRQGERRFSELRRWCTPLVLSVWEEGRKSPRKLLAFLGISHFDDRLYPFCPCHAPAGASVEDAGLCPGLPVAAFPR